MEWKVIGRVPVVRQKYLVDFYQPSLKYKGMNIETN